jgi:enoyl-CoA hydratase/carnithine racemase
VLASSNDKFFSIGLDIPQLFKLSRKDFTRFYKAFNRLCVDLYSFTKPTVAAISGHAIAGGCILTLCCDFRIIAEGRKLMGLNEAKLGVPVPYPADCILQETIGSQNAGKMMSSGDFYEPEALLQMGVVDRVLPQELVLPESTKKAASLHDEEGESFRKRKKGRVERVKAQILGSLEAKEERFVRHWYSDEARALLREAIEKF